MVSRSGKVGIAVLGAVALYVAQSALGSFFSGPEYREASPSWGSGWWIVAAILFGIGLIVGLVRESGAVSVALSVGVWLLPTVLAAVGMSDSLATALNFAALSIMFAFTFHFSGWLALLIALVAVFLSFGTQRNQEHGTKTLREQ